MLCCGHGEHCAKCEDRNVPQDGQHIDGDWGALDYSDLVVLAYVGQEGHNGNEVREAQVVQEVHDCIG